MCNKCNDMIFDYHTISLRLENIRKILCPWLVLLVQKFKRNEGDGKQKISVKDYHNDEGKKKHSKDEDVEEKGQCLRFFRVFLFITLFLKSRSDEN